MQSQKVRRWSWIVPAALAIIVSAGTVWAQGQPPDDDGPIKAPKATAVIVNDVVQVQGRLTNAGGVPINGAVNVTASIYDVSVGGVARCTDTDPVTVTNGLFTMSMDFCTASDFNGDQLFLGIKVGADAEMTPRQEIFAVPYAWALRPGAIVKGADSYIFVPGSSLVKNRNTDTTRWDIQAGGATLIYRGAAAGTKTVYFPITLPGVLYGQNVTLKSLTIYYKSSPTSYVGHIDMNLQTNADSWLNVFSDNTNLTSTTATSHTIPITTNNVLTSSQGILGLYLDLEFADDVSPVVIGGIRLTLGHQ